MKIGINAIAPKPAFLAGSEVYVINLIENLGKLDKENQYFIFVSKDNEDLYNLSYPNYTKVVCNVSSNSKYKRIFYEHMALPFILKRYKLDLFHAPQTTAPFFTHPNTVLTIHETIRFTHPELISKLMHYYYGINQSLTKKRLKRIIAVSESMKQELVQFIDVECRMVASVYNGISPKFLTPFQKGTSLSLPQKYILWVGRPYKHKNVETLVKAFDVLVKRHEIPQHLVLAGLEGFETDTITALIGKLGIKERVTIFGYVANESLPELYTKADVFVFPSLYESFGIPAIEAMAAKTPVVVSNIPALTEIVGDAGILVAPDSHEAMAKAVYKILQDEDFKNSLIEAGYKRAQGFTWEKTAIETLKVYLSALPH